MEVVSSAESGGVGGGGGGDGGAGVLDTGAGSIVWVRRRNGSWWPGRILGPQDLSASHLMSPRSGTPVKLLGREDASVDWYNLEKSKRVKAFRCGEFDDCIERAEASQGLPTKKREKYARREDAILHALELEKQFHEKKYGKLAKPVRENSSDSERKITVAPVRASNDDLCQPGRKLGKSNLMEKNRAPLLAQKAKDAIHPGFEDHTITPSSRLRGLHELRYNTMPMNRMLNSTTSEDSNRTAIDGSAYAVSGSGPCFKNSSDSDSSNSIGKGKRLLDSFAEESIRKRHHGLRPFVNVKQNSAELHNQSSHPDMSLKGISGDVMRFSVYTPAESSKLLSANQGPQGQMETPFSRLEVDTRLPQQVTFVEEAFSGSSEETESDSSETHSVEPRVEAGMLLSDADTSMRPQSRLRDRLTMQAGQESISNDESDEPSIDNRPQFHYLDQNASGAEVSKWQLKRYFKLIARETSIIKEEEELDNIEIHLHIDAKSLFRHFQHLDFILSLKSRFLMGLCTRESLLQITRKQSALPESFLRKDDLFYEDVKVLVERCFGRSNVETQQCMFDDDVHLFGLHNISRTILRMLDDLSNYGLYNLAKLLTRGLESFVKTRPQMKRVIKRSLLAIQSNQYPTDDQVKFLNELSQLLKSPNNFQQNYRKHVKLILKSHRADIMKVLDGLKDMSFHTLTAMYRKLKGVQRNNPQLYPCPSRKTKERLIKQVKKRSFDMIQQLDEADELQEPLVKAMAVAGLSLNVVSCSQDLSVPKFFYASPEIKALQDEIVKAIQLLDKRLKKHEMEMLRQLLDPDSTTVGKSLKSAMRNMLTDFLYDCIDMDVVPDSLLGALSLINKRLSLNACRSLSKDLMNEDVECILNVSAYLKQLLWKCDPSHQLDQDFMDAYMDEAEESDDGDIADDSDDDQKLPVNSTDGSQIRFNDFSEEVGSTSYADDACFISPSSTCEANVENKNGFASSKLVDDVCSDTETSQGEMLGSTIFKGVSSPLVSPGLVDDYIAMKKQDSFKDTTDVLNNKDNCSKHNITCGYQTNHYVTVQEVCDNASLVAFQLIGCVLSEFAQLEALDLDQNEESYLRGGESRPADFQDAIANSSNKDVSGSIVVEAVHKVLPSFSKRELEMVKKFMES